MKIAFIGLGAMGYPMAGHLQNAGHDVVVFNRTENKAAVWVDKYSGERASTPHLAAINADLVLIVLAMMMTYVAWFTVMMAYCQQ